MSGLVIRQIDRVTAQACAYLDRYLIIHPTESDVDRTETNTRTWLDGGIGWVEKDETPKDHSPHAPADSNTTMQLFALVPV